MSLGGRRRCRRRQARGYALGAYLHRCRDDPAFARIALTNAAAMLDSVETDPALDGRHRDAARALAAAYRTLTAKSSSDAFAEVEYRAALGDVNAKEAAMNEVCADGG